MFLEKHRISISNKMKKCALALKGYMVRQNIGNLKKDHPKPKKTKKTLETITPCHAPLTLAPSPSFLSYKAT